MASERPSSRSRAVSGNLDSEASFNTTGQHTDSNLPALSFEATQMQDTAGEISNQQRRQS